MLDDDGKLVAALREANKRVEQLTISEAATLMLTGVTTDRAEVNATIDSALLVAARVCGSSEMVEGMVMRIGTTETPPPWQQIAAMTLVLGMSLGIEIERQGWNVTE